MQEVEAICDRVIIIDNGKIVTDKKLNKLVEEEKEQIIEVEFDKTVLESLIASLPNIISYKNNFENNWTLTFNTIEDRRPLLFDFAQEHGLKTLQISLKSKNLEQIFREKTKKQS
jgi:ABC-2 type transport system ATP-binding protein